MNNIDIVYMSTIDWDFALQQRPHHIMRILSERGYKVHWLNSEQTCRINENKARMKVNDNLYIYNNYEVFIKKFKTPKIYFSTWSKRYEDLYHITPQWGVIYDSLDNFEANQKDELEMVRKSDVVLTTSKSLYKLQSKEHNNVHMCPNACFPELAKQYDIPNDLKKFKESGNPIILFSGALAQWCDIDLLESVANRYTLVMVGSKFGVSSIPENIHNLGCKTYDELQSYYSHCDITLLPFNKRQEALYSDPIKIYESLVHGKICVSTDIEEAYKFNPKVVLVSKTRQSFMNNIGKALKYANSDITKSICVEEASKNSWYRRVDVIERVIMSLAK